MCCNEDNFDPEPSGSVAVQEDGVDVVNPATALNFVGDGVSVADAGGGVATITITGGGGADTKQVFRYVADGDELTTFTVNLPAARANTNYNVQCTMGGPTANPFFGGSPRALVATFTVNGFDIEVPVAPSAGDIFMFTVEDLT